MSSKRTKRGRKARSRWHYEVIADAALTRWVCSPEMMRRFRRNVERRRILAEKQRAQWDALTARAEALLMKYAHLAEPQPSLPGVAP